MENQKTVNKKTLGHMAALLCAIIWGTTFISTKVVLSTFTPIEILVVRFVIGYLLLWALRPKRLAFQGIKWEANTFFAGVFGIALYYLAENYALEYTSAGNVSLIVSTAPFFIAITFRLLKESDEKFSLFFFLGFILAICGIALMNYSEGAFTFDLIGSLLALLGAILWGIYSVFIKRAGKENIDTIALTRRTFFYGIVVLLPIALALGFDISFDDFKDLRVLSNVVYLGVGASAICFVVWNFAIKSLGALVSGVYIYLVPAITVVFSYFFLNEGMNIYMIAGTVLVIIGLVISEK